MPVAPYNPQYQQVPPSTGVMPPNPNEMNPNQPAVPQQVSGYQQCK